MIRRERPSLWCSRCYSVEANLRKQKHPPPRGTAEFSSALLLYIEVASAIEGPSHAV